MLYSLEQGESGPGFDVNSDKTEYRDFQEDGVIFKSITTSENSRQFRIFR